MQSDELLIEKTKKLFEERTGWGDSDEWTNQDFVILSEKIQERTGVPLSHVTLKRVWGKVKYESLPNTHTLDTLVQFLGYGNWREFKSQNGNGKVAKPIPEQLAVNGNHYDAVAAEPVLKRKNAGRKSFLIGVAVLLLTLVVVYINLQPAAVAKSDYSFSSKKVITSGLPNSVIFNYDASKSPFDTVIIQQSWDPHLQARVSKNQHQHTSIYYYPDYYKAKLIVGGKIVSMHRLLIKTDGWLPILTMDPVPMYFTKADAMIDGKLALSLDKIESRNVKMQPSPPSVLYANVGDFGDIYSNDFVFETSVRNDYRVGAAACQNTELYILCEGTAIGIPLCAKGCVSDANLLFTGFFASGKQEDLSAFGVDFNSFVKVRVEAKGGKGLIYLDDKLVYTINKDIIRAKIVGFDFSFLGTGSIDYVRLSNSKVKYDEEF
jgi:hypothetical protein